ncbi:MAG TPA: substrate-binding domain-containing protein, partial [Gallicola sp.]|nr:substrate-binding domain-containing protein [Gallicola sp.]
GYKVPEDISVVGFDDNEVAKVISPPLTTIRVPVFEMGSLAVEKLCTMILQEKKLEEIAILPCKLIIRSSTGQLYQKNKT